MRAVVQRVNQATVTVEGQIQGRIGLGLMVLLGVGQEDGAEDAAYLVDKVINLRIFTDPDGKMNLSLKDVNGELMVVSQFTLYGDARHGRRPGFSSAARPEQGQALYETFVALAEERGMRVATGKFQHHMVVSLDNDGPVTILLDSKKNF